MELYRTLNNNLELPIFIGLATLLVLVNNRNIHLSGLARNLMNEYKGDVIQNRLIKNQIMIFKVRYFLTSISFFFLVVVLATSLYLFLNQVEVVNDIEIEDESWRQDYKFYASIWLSSLVVGIILLTAELLIGILTLRWHYNFVSASNNSTEIESE